MELDLDEELLREISQRAAASGRTMIEVIAETLREGLRPREEKAEPYRLRIPIMKGKLLPGVDLSNRDSLIEIMEADGDRREL